MKHRKDKLMIKGIHHVSMKTRNDTEYERVKKFYSEILGLKIIKECEACLLLDTGSGIVEIFRNGTEEAVRGVIRHFAFAVDDVKECVDAVSGAGYEVFVPMKEVDVGGDTNLHATIAFCKGPLGEEIEFFSSEW